MDSLPEHVARNRQAWDEWAKDFSPEGERCWRPETPVTWGIWGIPEEDVRMLPDALTGADAIELGCGAGYVSAWMTRRGAKVYGIDNSPAQLATAERLRAEHGLDIEFELGNAEQVPRPDSSFDFAISEYGACIWCDPYAWIPEAARLLRPGGKLHFLASGAWMMTTIGTGANDGTSDRLVRPYFGMHRFEWEGCKEVEFHLGHGEMFRLLKSCGFQVDDLIELQAPSGATTRYEFTTPEWSHRYPSEEIWKATKVR